MLGFLEHWHEAEISFGRMYSFVIFWMTMNAHPKRYLYDESKIIPYELPDYYSAKTVQRLRLPKLE